MAAKSRDIFGVQGLMGHAITRTSRVYVQTVSHQADKAVDLLREWYVQGVGKQRDHSPEHEE